MVVRVDCYLVHPLEGLAKKLALLDLLRLGKTFVNWMRQRARKLGKGGGGQSSSFLSFFATHNEI